MVRPVPAGVGRHRSGVTRETLTLLLDPTARPIIAHRGASAEAPENTLEAFRIAVAQGCDALELDVRLTRDGVAVVLHDPTLQRTTDRPGDVARLTFGELQAADAGGGFRSEDGSRPFAGRGIRIPAVAQVLEEFPHLPLLVEIKAPEAQHAVARDLERANAAGRCVVAAFNRGALDVLRREPFLIGADRREVATLYTRTRLGLATPMPRCRCYAVPWRWRDRIEVPSTGFINAARRHDRPVHVWTVDQPEVAKELWKRGASGIITNRPGLIRTAATST
ncbi:MAG TPA: glycerophosphodiester phosphodiesterase family protein [Gemmatimonadales bacterium]